MEQQGQRLEPGDLVIRDLAGQVAEKAIEASSWKVRASLAEARVGELEAALQKRDEDEGGPEGDGVN